MYDMAETHWVYLIGNTDVGLDGKRPQYHRMDQLFTEQEVADLKSSYCPRVKMGVTNNVLRRLDQLKGR